MQSTETLLAGDIVTGRVTDVQTLTKFQTGASKAFSLIFDGEPVQLSRQTTKTTLFVEPVNAYAAQGSPGSCRALLFFGDMNGQVARNNIIQARVKQGRGGSLVIRELNNLTTSTSVRPAAQLHPALVVLVAIAAALCAFWLIGAIVHLLTSGFLVNGLASLLWSVITALAPIIALLFIFRLLLGIR